jgi:hypothetical protein
MSSSGPLDFVKGDISSGLFLIFLAVGANFVAETLGCSLRKLLGGSMAAKHILVYALIYFTVNFTSAEPLTPSQQLIGSVLIYAWFVMFNKNIPETTVAVLLLVTASLFFKNFENYYSKTDDKKNVKTYKDLHTYSVYLAFGITLLGFYMYYVKQKADFGDNFDWGLFLFGKLDCANTEF